MISDSYAAEDIQGTGGQARAPAIGYRIGRKPTGGSGRAATARRKSPLSALGRFVRGIAAETAGFAHHRTRLDRLRARRARRGWLVGHAHILRLVDQNYFPSDHFGNEEERHDTECHRQRSQLRAVQ